MKIKVLLVDDEKEFVDALAERLEIRDFEVTKAYDGDEALNIIGSADVDVVVLDVMMPGKGGIEVLREIRKTRPLVEVLMLTGHASVETAIDGLKNGAFDYLMKPTETKELIAKIVLAYKRKNEQEERIRKARIDEILVRGRG
jgi:DNA-binding response OmpR family regulator